MRKHKAAEHILKWKLFDDEYDIEYPCFITNGDRIMYMSKDSSIFALGNYIRKNEITHWAYYNPVFPSPLSEEEKQQLIARREDLRTAQQQTINLLNSTIWKKIREDTEKSNDSYIPWAWTKDELPPERIPIHFIIEKGAHGHDGYFIDGSFWKEVVKEGDTDRFDKSDIIMWRLIKR